MKYREHNPPEVCMMTQSTCYKGTRKFTPKGILIHSTGASNPFLKRYVQPSDNAPDKAYWLEKLGKNQYGNDWNHSDRQAGMNFFIGKCADGTVQAVQTMPWDFRPWGCGSGPNGTCNDTHIQFEICEDNLTDRNYFDACYKETIEMIAYLCKMFNINPYGFVEYRGIRVPAIIDHIGSHELGLGSNHGDVRYWYKKFGKTLDDVRKDVSNQLMSTDVSPVIPSPTPVVTDLPTLKFGSQDSATRGTVAYLQRKLNSTGAKLTIDGDFGNKTKQAVIQFQIDNNLSADGIVGKMTWTAIERV